jgi:phenol hydroxylase P0 protein
MGGLETRYVRIRKSSASGYVSFDFAINDPSLSVELILPYPAFVEFCDQNNVVFMTPEQGAQVDRERLKWRTGRPHT